jgi:hypothetical protein
MADSRVVQLVIFPHRPIHSDAELEAELKGPLALLLRYLHRWQFYQVCNVP